MSSKSRRTFLKAAAVTTAGYWVAGGVSARASTSALETINFACIGVGGKGTSDSDDAARNGNIAAICDIDERNLERAGKKWSKAEKFFDYRKMFDAMEKTIDAVTVSTPDHNHAAASALALHAKKACFTQKPLTHSIYEARQLAALARENKCATQMGNQGTANSGLRQASALIKTGVLGPIKEVHVWTNRPVWPQGLDRPSETPEVPSHIHWQEFLGPAKDRPYHPAYHPFKWRGWWDFGTGALGDMACHTLNMPYHALSLADPTSVTAETSGHNRETYPSWSVIEFEFPAKGDRGACKLFWYDGGKQPAEALLQGAKMNRSGALIVGEKGSLYSPGDYADKYELLGDVEGKEVEFERSPGHFAEWVAAIKGGKPAMSNFPDYAGPLTETILLGNLAVWADGKRVEWDAKNMKVTNETGVEGLDEIIRHEYRDGYTLFDTAKV